MKKTLLAWVLVLSLLPVFAESDTRPLGGLIAAWVEVGDDLGLVRIEGIRASVRDADLTAVDDLTIRLRWEGGGEHAFVRTPYDEMGEVIRSEDWPTIFTAHEAEDALFDVPGFYDVAVSLDREVALAISRYRPSAVDGSFGYFIYRKLPRADGVAIVTLWIGGDSSFDPKVELTDSEGELIAVSKAQHLVAYPRELTALMNYFEDFVFGVEGDYGVSVFLDDKRVLYLPIRVETEK
jgi:hypothetical protein